MHALLTVLVFLMVFSGISLQNYYRHSIDLQSVHLFMQIQRGKERTVWNTTTQEKYEGEIAEIKKKKENRNKGDPASSRQFPFTLFLSTSSRNQNPNLFNQHRLFLYQLIQNNYAQNDEEKALVSPLVNRLSEVLPTHKISNIKALGNVELNDEALDAFFARILRGGIDGKNPIPFETRATVKTEKTKLQVYLADKEFLKIIFGSEEVASLVMSERKKLYNELNRDNSVREELTRRFKESFLPRARSEFSEEFLDFSVSKTWPGKSN